MSPFRTSAAATEDVRHAWLLRIAERPDDDALRMVMASDLMQRGDPLGEYIAVTLQLNQPALPSETRAKLEQRSSELVRAHKKEWVAPIEPFVIRADCDRGLVEKFQMLTISFSRSVNQILERMPTIRRATLLSERLVGDGRYPESAPSDYLADALRMPALSRFIELSLPPLLVEGCAELARANVPLLRILSLRGRPSFPMGDAGIAELARGRWPALAKLDVAGQSLGPAAMQSLAQTSWPLTTLDVGQNAIGDLGVEALVSAPFARSLETLSVGSCSFRARGAQALAYAPALSQLDTLMLAGNKPSPEGLFALGRSTTLASLRVLNLGACDVTREGLAAFIRGLEAGGLPSLRQVALHMNDAPKAQLDAMLEPVLARRPYMGCQPKVEMSGLHQTTNVGWPRVLLELRSRVRRLLREF